MIIGFFRLIVLAFLLYAGWAVFKVLFRILGVVLQVRQVMKNAGGGAATTQSKDSRNIEEMAQDPACGSYVSTAHSISRDFRGGRLYFCSQKCLDDYKMRTAHS